MRQSKAGFLLLARARCLHVGIRRQEYWVESESLHCDRTSRDEKLHDRSRPTTTVVVAWSGSSSELEGALGSLMPRCDAAAAELIVVGPTSLSERRRLGRQWPDLKVIDAPASLSRKQLREIGAGAAHGDIVLLLDDETPFAPLTERPLSANFSNDREESPYSMSGLTAWLEAMAPLSAALDDQAPAGAASPRTLVASWRSVTALLGELSRVRLIRTSRAAGS